MLNMAGLWCVQTIVKTFEECVVPVRTAKFIARKHWVVAGGVSPSFKVTPHTHTRPSLLLSLNQDDMMIRVFNYNTLGRVHMFEAHKDYIRCMAVHPTQPYILTCSGEATSTTCSDVVKYLWHWCILAITCGFFPLY